MTAVTTATPSAPPLLLAQATATTPAAPPPGITGAADPLAGMRDIELPPAPGWWPPAPGWWLLAALLAGAGLLAFRRWQRWYARRRPWRAARAAIAALEQRASADDADAVLLAGELSDVLRRYALVRWPRTQVARLADRDWRSFLGETGAPVLAGKAGELLTQARYRPAAPATEQAAQQNALAAALAAAREWVDLHRPGAGTPPPDAGATRRMPDSSMDEPSTAPRAIEVQP